MTLDKRGSTLISIGASVAANCQPCLRHYIDVAAEVGLSDQEIQDAIEVGRTVKKGAARHMDHYAATILGEITDTSTTGTNACGCGSAK